MQHRLGRDEHPLPVGGTVDAGGRFVGRDDPRRCERLLDRRAFGGHRGLCATKSVGDRAFGDFQPEQLGHHLRQPREADVVAVVPVEQQRPDPGAKRRSRRHAVGRLRAIALAAAAASAIKLDPGDVRADRRDVDMLVAAPPVLSRARHVGRAVRTPCGEALDRLVGLITHPAGDTGPRRPRLARLRLALPRTSTGFLVLRRRRMAVLRRLLRLRQQRHEFRYPGVEGLNTRHQPIDRNRPVWAAFCCEAGSAKMRR